MAATVDPDKNSNTKWEIFTSSNEDQPICSICQENIEKEQTVISHLAQTSNKTQTYLHFFSRKLF